MPLICFFVSRTIIDSYMHVCHTEANNNGSVLKTHMNAYTLPTSIYIYYSKITHTYAHTFQNALLIRVQLSTVHDMPAISFDTKCSRCRISNAFSCAQRNENTRFEIYKRSRQHVTAHHQIRIFDTNISI